MGNSSSSSSSSRPDDHHHHNHQQHHSPPQPTYQTLAGRPLPAQPQQPYNPYAQTRVYPPPPAGYTPGYQGYNNGQYYGQFGNYPPYQQQGASYQQPYMQGQYGQHLPRHGPPGASYQQQQQQQPAPGPPPQELNAYQTIKNQVNLKKSSIKVQPVPGNSRYAITFSFDATASCRVSVFVNSTDDSSKNRILSQQAPLIVAKCDKGMGINCPSAAGPGAGPLTISADLLKDWASMPEDRFPIVIRLEALTDEGRAEGRSLDSVEPGGELPQWVQSQTTYAKMQRHGDGMWTPAHVLQKLSFKGRVFELQEIYGMEQGRPAETVDGFDEIEGNECVICMSEPRDTTALPCRHMCMCHTCANELKTQTNKCPICRNVITSFLHIKIAPHNQHPPGQGAAGAGAMGATGAGAGASGAAVRAGTAAAAGTTVPAATTARPVGSAAR